MWSEREEESVNIAIEVDTLDRHLGFDLFAPNKTLGSGVSTEIPEVLHFCLRVCTFGKLWVFQRLCSLY